MLHRIFSAFGIKQEERPALATLLAETGVHETRRPKFIDGGPGVPALEAGYALNGFYKHGCSVFSHIKEPVVRIPSGIESVSLRSVEGCIHSRSQLTSFKDMYAILQDRHIENLEYASERLSNDLFNRESGVMTRGKPASIFRQVWDGRMWFANDDGSHRAAALHKLDSMREYDRFIDCDITDFDFSPAVKSLCQSHGIFIFKADHLMPLIEFVKPLADGGVAIARGSNWEEGITCIAVPKTHAEYEAARIALSSAFCYSDLVNSLLRNDFIKPAVATTLAPGF